MQRDEIVRQVIHAAQLEIMRRTGEYVVLMERYGVYDQRADAAPLMGVIAQALGLTVDDYYEGRKKECVQLRWLYVHFCLSLFPGMSHGQIAKRLNLDRTTIIHAHQQHKRKIEKGDAVYLLLFDAALTAVNNWKNGKNKTTSETARPGRDDVYVHGRV